MTKYKIGFLGAGRMATALAKGVVRSGVAQPSEIAASDPNEAVRQRFSAAVGGSMIGADNVQLADKSNCVVLAVKPQSCSVRLPTSKRTSAHQPLVISIAAGVRLAQLAEWLPSGTRLVRVMPNTPALVGKGASGFTMGAGTTDADRHLVARLFDGVGWSCELPRNCSMP